MSTMDEYMAERQRADNEKANKTWHELTPERQQFFRKLLALCTQFGVEIRGCGCCGAPTIGDVDIVQIEAGKLTFADGVVLKKLGRKKA